MNILSILLFITLSTLSIYSKLLKPVLYRKFKILPLILLVFLLTNNLYSHGITSIKIIILIGIIMGMIGDLFLLNSEKYFIFGLISFLAGHIFYIIAFFKNINNTFYISLSILLFFGAIYLKILFKKMEPKNVTKYFLPIIIYIITIVLLFSTAFNYENSNKTSFYLTIGSTFFILSDATLAWNTFVNDFKNSELIISLTYYSAQFFIILKALTI